MPPITAHKAYGLYEKYLKRSLDVVCALAAMIVFCWLYALLAILVLVKLGGPVIFKQQRPGRINPKTGQETIFTLYKFRTMTDERDEEGELLSDDIRLTRFGRILRGTSLDELPEAINILKGDMSVIGPRPQLVRDMVFMTEEQRQRHTIRPGLSGLAQVSGRNALAWKNKLALDLVYLEKITFWGDLKLVFKTVINAFVRQEGITDGNMATSLDYGDYLLRIGEVSEEEYYKKQALALKLLEKQAS